MRETATLTVNDAPFVEEEQFGPVLPTISDCDVNAAIAAANNSPTALGGSIGSSDVEAARRMAQQMECGSI